MAALQKAVSVGYTHYTTGMILAIRAPLLVEKFDERFSISATGKQREYAAKRDRCSFRLVFFPMPDRTAFRFWLLRTAGEHPLLGTEDWRDARVSPVQWPFIYELRQLPVPPDHRQNFKRPSGRIAINPVTWTWRIRRDEVDRLKACIRHWAQHSDERMKQLVRGLSLAPGFRGVRDDVWSLHQYIARQCSRRKSLPPAFAHRRWLALPKGRTFRKYPLSYLVARIQRGEETWFPEDATALDTVLDPIMQELPHA